MLSQDKPDLIVFVGHSVLHLPSCVWRIVILVYFWSLSLDFVGSNRSIEVAVVQTEFKLLGCDISYNNYLGRFKNILTYVLDWIKITDQGK